ncbi:MAG: alkanesulfonate monooxygenase SsuD [Candidatus Poriferisodalaceae bacterium]|jgi:alkanesulfonate monooxygenase SsuD/methylene tetrahydromethanopterin reductase-like flavin-dependent oxidoreductase (luciferase family)
MQMPAISLAAVRGRRQQTLEAAAEIERRGFSGIFCPSLGDCVALSQGIASATNEIVFGTSVQPIYFRNPEDLAATAAFIHEISNGRFRLGIGVTHGPVHQRLGITPGKPLGDMRDYVAAMQAAAEFHGELPPIVLATLRRKMVELSVEISSGAVWANASRNDFHNSVADIPDNTDDFFIGNMIPTVIDPDREAGAARNRKTLQGYVSLPNYRNYWKQAGYTEEMEGIEAAIADGDRERVLTCMSDEWLSNATLYGSVDQVREGVEEWFAQGCKTPILVPSSTSGGQMHALQEIFDAFS